MSVMNNHRTTKRTLKTVEKIAKKLSFERLLWAIRRCDETAQTVFAQKLGMSRQRLCDIENGRRFVSPKMAARYVHIVDYSVAQFVRLCVQDMLVHNGL